MSEGLKIIIAGLIVLAAGIPFVIFFDKAKKEMEKELNEKEKNEK